MLPPRAPQSNPVSCLVLGRRGAAAPFARGAMRVLKPKEFNSQILEPG